MNRSLTLIIAVHVLIGCAAVPDVSTVCRRMCTVATDLYGECLESWGVDWSDAGFEGAAAHQETCEVWSWEIAELYDRSASDRLCRERSEILRSGACNDYTDINWSEMP